MKIIKHEKIKKIIIISIFISYHLSKLLIIYVLNIIQISHYAINFLNIYAINNKRISQFIKKA